MRSTFYLYTTKRETIWLENSIGLQNVLCKGVARNLNVICTVLILFGINMKLGIISSIICKKGFPALEIIAFSKHIKNSLVNSNLGYYYSYY